MALHYFVILTKECNLLCKYCGGGSNTPPKEIAYTMQELSNFLSKDSKPVIEFYGGEPLLRTGTMTRMIAALPARFALQTNGLLLDRLEPRVLERLEAILVSVDGPQEVTDRERGAGVYERVVKNARGLREKGFRGDLVARMTVVQGSDIRESVLHLLKTGLFDHVHWQLDFGMFWDAGEQTEPGLDEWIGRYNAGVTSLVEWWVGEMRATGRVPGIVPFIGITRTILEGKPSRLRCGSGIDFFAIMPDGRISACPVSLDFGFSVVGSIGGSDPGTLRDSALVGEPCTSCDIYGICGGRCLFVNRSQWMLREGGFVAICRTVKHLVRELIRVQSDVKALIDTGAVEESEFRYPEFNNGCEVIP